MQGLRGRGRAGICQHNRPSVIKSPYTQEHLQDCGDTSSCSHNNRRRRECKECGGAGICQHNRRRSECQDFGNASASITASGSCAETGASPSAPTVDRGATARTASAANKSSKAKPLLSSQQAPYMGAHMQVQTRCV